MGISFTRKICYFGPARSGSHAVEGRLKDRLGDDFIGFLENDDFTVFLATRGSSYFEFNGDHTRAVVIQRLFPQVREFRSAATFRDPFKRIESLFCFTAEHSGAEISQDAFERWVDLVFCNRYNSLGRAHSLQTDLFMDDLGGVCVDRVYDTARLDDLIGYLLEPDPHENPVSVINCSVHSVAVGDLSSRVLERLIVTIAPDLAFWETLKARGGVWRRA